MTISNIIQPIVHPVARRITDPSLVVSSAPSINQAWQAHAYYEPWYDGNTILDQRSGIGDSRPQQPRRAYNGDGVGYIVIPTGIISKTNDFSGQVSFKITTLVNSGIVSITNDGSDRFMIAISDNRLVVEVWNGSSYASASIDGELVVGQWHDVVFSYDSAGHEMTATLDGVDMPGGSNLTAAAAVSARIGARSSNDWQFDGVISDIRLVDENGDYAAFYKCDDTHPTIAYDSGPNKNHGTKTNITLPDFHYEGGDVPSSWQNSVGYSPVRNLFANTEFAGGVSGSPGTVPTNWDQRFWTSWTFNMSFTDGVWEVEQTELSRITLGKQFSVTEGDTCTLSVDCFVVAQGTSGYISSLIGGSLAVFTEDEFYINGELVNSNEPLPVGEWVRIACKMTANSTGTGFPGFGLPVATRSGWTVRFKNPQLESGTVATDYQQNLTLDYPHDGDYLPLRADDPTLDVFDNLATYTGEVPKPSSFEDSHCATGDGAGTYIDTNTNTLLVGNTFSLTFWIKPLIRPASNERIFANKSSASSDGILVTNEENEIRVSVANGEEIKTPNDALAIGVWSHVAILIDAATETQKIFIDGVEATYEATIDFANVAADLDQAENYVIGSTPVGPHTATFEASLCDFKVYDDVLTVDEIDYIRTEGQTGTDPTNDNSVLDYWMTEGAGIKHYDRSGNENHGNVINATFPDYWAQRQSVFHPNLKNGCSRYFLGTGDDSDSELILTQPECAAKSSATITFTINTTDIKFIVFGQGLTTWLMAVNDGSTGSIYNASGSPTFYVDDVEVTTETRQNLFDLICDGVDHEIRIENVNLSSYNGLYFVGYSNSDWNFTGVVKDLTIDDVPYSSARKIPAQSSTLDALGNALTNPAIVGHNGAETRWNMVQEADAGWMPAGLETDYEFGDARTPPNYKTVVDAANHETKFYTERE